jgi:rSAM/selenodomain-associated transferase 1
MNLLWLKEMDLTLMPSLAREPVAGTAKTRLIPAVGAAGAAVLYRAFTADLCAALGGRFRVSVACAPTAARPYFRRLGVRYGFALCDQGPGDHGARMRRAAEAALGGARRVVILGTDAPTLPMHTVRAAFAALRRRRVVLGPSLDGGYYLLGLRAPVPDLFRGIPWGTEDVLARTLARLRRAGVTPALLPPWYDVDTGDDVRLLRRHLRLLATCGRRPCPRTARALARLRVSP